MIPRANAEDEVQALYLCALGRDPFPPGYDAAAYDYVFDRMREGKTLEAIEADLRSSGEAHGRAKLKVDQLYLEELGRHILAAPGDPLSELSDPGAQGYVDDFRLGKKSEDRIREDLRGSEEYRNRNRFQRALRVEVLDNVLWEPESDARSFELSISLFYAVSPSVSRETYLGVIAELARAGVQQARFAGSTFTWDNPVRKQNVIPFAPGKTYVHRVKTDGVPSVDYGVGVDPVLDPRHLEELEWRLNRLVEHGIRAQYTIFWGGMQPLFTTGDDGRPGHPPGEGGRGIVWDRVERYLEDIAKFFAQHPEHPLEIINEADHGHHLGKLGQKGREEFLSRCARIIRRHHPQAVIAASDGGRNPDEEGDPYFRYHGVRELSYWNVHYPRDTITVEQIPRWARGPWHLFQDRDPFRKAHGGTGGYGRSDENIFLTLQEEFERWGYRGGTRDWRMRGVALWVTTMAGAGDTLHTFKGFFCEPGVTTDPIFRVVQAWVELTYGFVWSGASSFNAGWTGSPVKAFDGPFKAFALASGQDREGILITVLNPNRGRLVLNTHRPYLWEAREITGELLDTGELAAGVKTVALPATSYSHCLVMRLWAKE